MLIYEIGLTLGKSPGVAAGVQQDRQISPPFLSEVCRLFSATEKLSGAGGKI